MSLVNLVSEPKLFASSLNSLNSLNSLLFYLCSFALAKRGYFLIYSGKQPLFEI